MKKITAMILVIVMLAMCMVGCGQKGKTLDDVKKAGKLVVATSPDFPPFEYLDGTTPVGIEIELAQKVCDKLGVKLEVAQMDFDSVLPGVQAGKYDVGVAGISVDEERQKNSLFTDPYCLAAQSIVVPAGSDITCKADLEGKSVACQSGTTADKFCQQSGYTVSAFTNNSDAQTALTTGKVDAWVIDDLTAYEMVNIYNADNADQLVILNEAMTTEPYAFAFKLGDDALVAEINKVLNEMIADGTVAGVFEKYDAPYTSPAGN